MLPSTTVRSSQSFTTYPSAALAVPGWESITAIGGSVHTRTHAVFCIIARGSTWASATRPTTVIRCCGQLWSGHNRTNRLPWQDAYAVRIHPMSSPQITRMLDFVVTAANNAAHAMTTAFNTYSHLRRLALIIPFYVTYASRLRIRTA